MSRPSVCIGTYGIYSYLRGLSQPWNCRFGSVEGLDRLLHTVDTPRDPFQQRRVSDGYSIVNKVCLRLETVRIRLRIQTALENTQRSEHGSSPSRPARDHHFRILDSADRRKEKGPMARGPPSIIKREVGSSWCQIHPPIGSESVEVRLWVWSSAFFWSDCCVPRVSNLKHV